MFVNTKLVTVEAINNVSHVSSMLCNVLFARSNMNNNALQLMGDSDKATVELQLKVITILIYNNGKFKLQIPFFFEFLENFVAL